MMCDKKTCEISTQTENNICEISTQSDVSIDVNIKSNTDKTILILSGGGQKGYAMIGAIYFMEELDKLRHINTFVGTSVGSIICAMLVLGYNCSEIHDMALLIDCFQIYNVDLLKFSMITVQMTVNISLI